MSRPTKPTLPPGSTILPTATVSNAASLSGTYPITVAANTIIQPRAKLTSAYGPVTIGEGCIVAERAVVGLQSKADGDSKGVVLGNGVVVESGARVEGRIEEGAMVEVGAVVGMGSTVGKFSKISPLCSVPANEVLPDHTIIYGNNPTQRRTEKKGLESLRATAVKRHIEVLRKM